MSTTVAPTRAGSALLTRLADEEVFVGHVLTSIAGFGPELEINLSLSSIGQDELGHARLLHVLVRGAERSAVNDAIWGRDVDSFPVSPLAAAYTEDWADCVAAHLLYDTADAHRLTVLARSTDEEVRAVAEKMAVEERYHVDFWTTWLGSTAGASADARRRMQDALDRYAPLGATLFDPDDGEDLGLGAELWAEAHARWSAEIVALAERHGLEVRWDGPLIDLRADRDRILDELHHVYREAPGQW